MTFTPSQQFNAVITAIDAVNAEDPRTTVADGDALPFETVYANRMTETGFVRRIDRFHFGHQGLGRSTATTFRSSAPLYST